MQQTTFSLLVHAIRYDGENTRIIELRPAAGTHLPPVEAGAHIDVHISADLIRQYSLCNTPGETHRYVIGVALDPNSRGGSRWLHDNLQAGDTLTVGAPRNHFRLANTDAHTVLIGGGIGVTPLLSMALPHPRTRIFRTSQRRRRASAIRLITGFGSVSMSRGNGWADTQQQYKMSPSELSL